MNTNNQFSSDHSFDMMRNSNVITNNEINNNSTNHVGNTTTSTTSSGTSSADGANTNVLSSHNNNGSVATSNNNNNNNNNNKNTSSGTNTTSTTNTTNTNTSNTSTNTSTTINNRTSTNHKRQFIQPPPPSPPFQHPHKVQQEQIHQQIIKSNSNVNSTISSSLINNTLVEESSSLSSSSPTTAVTRATLPSHHSQTKIRNSNGNLKVTGGTTSKCNKKIPIVSDSQALLRAASAPSTIPRVYYNSNNNTTTSHGAFVRPPTSTNVSGTLYRNNVSVQYSNNNNNNDTRHSFINTNDTKNTKQHHNNEEENDQITGEWKVVDIIDHHSNNYNNLNNNNSDNSPPCERSLHASALWNDQLLIFGGYDGQSRRNDFYSFHFKKRKWSLIIPTPDTNGNNNIPTPRDRHCAIAYGNSFYIFGGFDGTSRVNDFYEFDFTVMMWKHLLPSSNNGGNGGSIVPSPRHSHNAVVYQDSMYVFGGYDGSYRSDFYEYKFLNNTWLNIPAVGRSPRARYRASSVVYKDKLILYGGHDGTRHIPDIHFFDFTTRSWSMVVDIVGNPPLARDSHICAIHEDSMFVFGGSAGSAMNDVYELKLKDNHEDYCHEGDSSLDEDNDFVPIWRQVKTTGSISHRFCHIGAIYDGCFYVFGGYDGSSRLNDFMMLELKLDDLSYNVPPSTLVTDMRSFVNNESFSDVVFIVEGQMIYAHKLMLARCNYFRAMFNGSMMESKLSSIQLEDVSYNIFLSVLEYLYTDNLDIQVESAMELFAAADLFDIPRLRSMCEQKMLQSIEPDNAATIFHAADELNAVLLRKKSLKFILKHFEQVSKSQAFEEMARTNVELVVEILRLR